MTYAEKIAAADRELDLDGVPEESAPPHPCAVTAHRRPRELDGRPVTIWKARVEDGRLVPDDVQPENRRRHDVRGLPPRPAAVSTVDPARRAAYEVVRRVFEQDAYADRVLRHCRRRARRARAGARPAHRVRHGAARSHARSRHRSARPAARAQARPAGAGRPSDRRVPARLPRRRPRPRSRERERRARARGSLERAVRLHERRHAPARDGAPRAGRLAARGTP